MPSSRKITGESPLKDSSSVVASQGLPLTKNLTDRMQRTWAAVAYFCSGALAINASQLLATPMSSINPELYRSWMSQTKGSFGLLTTTMTQLWAPTIMRISGDASMRGQIIQTDAGSGDVFCDFPRRLVLIANHQIYTDWLYLWWVAYTAGRHADVHVVLKESLKNLPVIGWGMQLNRFIFLRRDWAHDEALLRAHMRRLHADREDPMWLLMFPEGTNLAVGTRQKSARWAFRNGVRDLRHTLLPRSTGLRACLNGLHGSVEWLYDCTVAYDGVQRGQFAFDIFPLPAAYIEGRPPRAVSMHWRRFHISTIPLDDTKAFDLWLQSRWREKDALIEHWYTHGGRFPADSGVEIGPRGEFRRGVGIIEANVKASRLQDFFQVLGPIALLALLMVLMYGALPKEVSGVISRQAAAVLGGEAVEAAKRTVGQKKLLAFDGSGWQKIDKGNRGGQRRTTVSVTKVAARGKATSQNIPKVTQKKDKSGVSEARLPLSNPQKKLLGFSDGQFKEIPGPSAASAASRGPGSATSKGSSPPRLRQKLSTGKWETSKDQPKLPTKSSNESNRTGIRKIPIPKLEQRNKPN